MHPSSKLGPFSFWPTRGIISRLVILPANGMRYRRSQDGVHCCMGDNIKKQDMVISKEVMVKLLELFEWDYQL
jgi:hypothetical protein